MRYLEKMQNVCDICGEPRRWGDHSACSKQRQAEHQNDKRRKAQNKKVNSKSSEEYFTELLKRIGE